MESREATVLFCDNQAAIALTQSKTFNRRTKHWDIRYHFVRYHQEMNTILVKFKRSEEQIADLLTKSLPAQVIFKHMEALGMSSLQY